ncbi:hypothetical protein Runsl_0184 [Runella slithyformis DSM 19594]|uniref:Uncharacterized protein n=1 Tax=Runella slithyformis (strain ATCC 29530 / DSM 19594 / LMG 11500 / NCIMB 11436 / LSU 4) TaxID=761193 RepID=A0A7U3ZG74_RUNSL|nr:hypothetical protein Runsl_0184 [Runella slithyformis DSM 19594]
MRFLNNTDFRPRNRIFPVIDQSGQLVALPGKNHLYGYISLLQNRNTIKWVGNKYITDSAFNAYISYFLVQKIGRNRLMKRIVYISTCLELHNFFGACHGIGGHNLRLETVLQVLKTAIDCFLRKHCRKLILVKTVKIPVDHGISVRDHRSRIDQYQLSQMPSRLRSIRTGNFSSKSMPNYRPFGYPQYHAQGLNICDSFGKIDG